jgi:PAS domain S-box-containing protein
MKLKDDVAKRLSILDFAPVGMCVIDQDFSVIFWNRCLELWTGIPRDEILGAPIEDFVPLFRETRYEARIRSTFEDGTPVLFSSLFHKRIFPSRVKMYSDQIQQTTATLITLDGSRYVMFSVENMTSLQQRTEQYKKEIKRRIRSEKRLEEIVAEREMLIKETHHRIKNNLTLILSIINIEAKNVVDQAVVHNLMNLENRIHSIMLVHERLYKSDDLKYIELNVYLNDLSSNLLYDIYNQKKRIELNFSGEPMHLEAARAVSIGLIVTEIITNSVKYAFKDREHGNVTLEMKRTNDTLELFISDDGCGIKTDPAEAPEKGLGTQLIDALVDQLGGTYELSMENGTAYRIRVPVKGMK